MLNFGNYQNQLSSPNGMSEKREQGIGSLLQWNALLITFALFLTLASLDFINTTREWDSILMLIVLVIIALALLITSADFFIEGAKGLARRAGIAEVVIGLTIVSIGTSLPEILVTSTASATAGSDPALMDLAVGNIYGSVLVQITLVLGIVVAFRPLEIRPAWLRRDGLLMLASIVILTGLLWEGDGLDRIEGAILCLIYATYIMWLLLFSTLIPHLKLVLDIDKSFNPDLTKLITSFLLDFG